MAAIAIEESIKNVARQYADLLKKEMHIKSVYLFGSRAKEQYHEDSDIDIAIISNDFQGDIIEDTYKLLKLRRKVDLRIEPHPFRPEDFNDTNPLVKEISKAMIRIDE